MKILPSRSHLSSAQDGNPLSLILLMYDLMKLFRLSSVVLFKNRDRK